MWRVGGEEERGEGSWGQEKALRGKDAARGLQGKAVVPFLVEQEL